jgi:hypothetical protein
LIALKGIDEDDLRLYLLVLQCFEADEALQDDELKLLLEIEKEECRRHRKQRVKRVDRMLFKKEMDRWPEYRIKRFFRMSSTSYKKLCQILCDCVGEATFIPQSMLDEEKGRQQQGAITSSGGKLSGETRVAIFLRLLAGGTYLDLMVIFQVVHDPIYRSFKMVCKWVMKAFKFPLVPALESEDLEYFKSVSSSFAEGASHGVFKGCIGALDGLAVRIRRPTLSKTIPNPGAYFCRKGFFALNCQAICDANKKISWISSKHIGSCHDSVAFTDTKLYDLLLRKQEFLYQNRLFIVGDSAYNLESFLLVPFDRPKPQSAEDAYNFYHSSCRIRIECAFGEIVMRFGLLWKTLQFDISVVGDIMSAACLLHNFIIDERGDGGDTSNYAATPPDEGFVARDMDDLPLVADNNEPRPKGRPSGQSVGSKEKGSHIRETITLTLKGNGLARPLQPGFKYNQYGMVYMEY